MNRCLVALTASLLIGPWSFPVAASDGLPVKDPRAIEILKRADAVIRDLEGLAFRSSYVGTHTSRGRVTADVLLRREAGRDDVTGTIAYRLRAEIEAAEAPYGLGHLPRRYVLTDGTKDGAMLVDPAEQTVRTAEGNARQGLIIGAANAVLPQYTRVDPLKLEIENSIAASYLGTANAGGVSTHVVWLKFGDRSGLGEQLLYIGEHDYLLRKATLTAPRVVLTPATDAAPETAYPNVHFELTLSDLRTLQEIPDDRFAVATAGYREASPGEPPAVGDPGPSWVLESANGGSVADRDLRGQVSYLYFWASWCPICQAYLPEVQALDDELENVRVVAINALDRDDPLGYVRGIGYDFEVLMGGDDLLLNRLQFMGLPALVVLDRDGTIRHRELLPRLDAAGQVRALLQELVAEPVQAREQP
jgi:thiol-disulfide isomerase/thioredoxin